MKKKDNLSIENYLIEFYRCLLLFIENKYELLRGENWKRMKNDPFLFLSRFLLLLSLLLSSPIKWGFLR